MIERKPRQEKVWDLPTRVFHWVLVANVVFSYVTASLGEYELHQVSGLSILILIVFRVFWGLFGGRHARFSSFLRGPAHVIAYCRALARREPDHGVGHNPLGALSILAMLTILALQASLGLFANDDASFKGPLYHLVDPETSNSITSWHHRVFLFGVVSLVILHLAAILGYAIMHRKNLVRPMVTGWAKSEIQDDQITSSETVPVDHPVDGSPLGASVYLAVSIALVLGTIELLQ